MSRHRKERIVFESCNGCGSVITIGHCQSPECRWNPEYEMLWRFAEFDSPVGDSEMDMIADELELGEQRNSVRLHRERRYHCGPRADRFTNSDVVEQRTARRQRARDIEAQLTDSWTTADERSYWREIEHEYYLKHHGSYANFLVWEQNERHASIGYDLDAEEVAAAVGSYDLDAAEPEDSSLHLECRGCGSANFGYCNDDRCSWSPYYDDTNDIAPGDSDEDLIANACLEQDEQRKRLFQNNDAEYAHRARRSPFRVKWEHKLVRRARQQSERDIEQRFSTQNRRIPLSHEERLELYADTIAIANGYNPEQEEYAAQTGADDESIEMLEWRYYGWIDFIDDDWFSSEELTASDEEGSAAPFDRRYYGQLVDWC